MSSQTMYKRLFGTESLDEVLARSKHRVQEIAQRRTMPEFKIVRRAGLLKRSFAPSSPLHNSPKLSR